MLKRYFLISVFLRVLSLDVAVAAPWAGPFLFELAPVGILSGSVRVNGAQVPREIKIEVVPRSEARGAGRAKTGFACTAVGKRFACPLPAGAGDVRLVTPGFAPVYFWSVSAEPGGTVEVGDIFLHSGASVTGWVQIPDDASSFDKVTVVVEPEAFGWQGNPAERKRSELRRHDSPVSRSGFFQLTGLSPGTYLLTAKASGLSPSRVQLDVPESREIALAEPLRLDRLANLRLWLTPAANLDGSPWQIELFSRMPATNVYESLERSAAALDGSWSSRPLEAGTYEISVRDTAGSNLHQAVHQVDSTAPPLFVDLDLVPVQGTVTLGGQPLKAALVFGTTNREPNVRVEADAEGRFEGYLPRAGLWPVEVVLAGDRKQRSADVDVKRLAGGEPDIVKVALPDTRVAGRVTAHGEPVREAFVVMVAKGSDGTSRREAAVRVDRYGAFEALGLSEGRISVRAYDRSRTSEWIDIEVVEGTDASDLALELGERIVVKGTLASANGFAAGGLVVAWQELNSKSVWLGETVSAADGSFELSVDARAEALKVVAAIPGCGVEMGRFPVPREPEKRLAVACAGQKGEILLRGGSKPGDLFFHGGAGIEMNALLGVLDRAGFLGWSEDGPLLRSMPEGRYQVCTTGSCRNGELLPGGSLSFAPPGAGQAGGQ